MGRYRGNRRMTLVEPGGERTHLLVQVAPRDITLFTKLMEGYGHLAFVVPMEPQEGILLVHTTPGLFGDVEKIITSLPMAAKIMKKPSS